MSSSRSSCPRRNHRRIGETGAVAAAAAADVVVTSVVRAPGKALVSVVVVIADVGAAVAAGREREREREQNKKSGKSWCVSTVVVLTLQNSTFCRACFTRVAITVFVDSEWHRSRQHPGLIASLLFCTPGFCQQKGLHLDPPLHVYDESISFVIRISTSCAGAALACIQQLCHSLSLSLPLSFGLSPSLSLSLPLFFSLSLSVSLSLSLWHELYNFCAAPAFSVSLDR